MKTTCRATCNGYVCPLDLGHEGDHAAHLLNAAGGAGCVKWANNASTDVICGSKSDSYVCTLPNGHGSYHVAHRIDGREVARWPQSHRLCEAYHQGNQVVCTEAYMHDGPHVARMGGRGRILHSWPRNGNPEQPRPAKRHEPHVEIANNPPPWAEPTAWRCAVAAAYEWCVSFGVRLTTSDLASLFGPVGDVTLAIKNGPKGGSRRTATAASDAYQRARFQPSRTHAAFVPRERKR